MSEPKPGAAEKQDAHLEAISLRSLEARSLPTVEIMFSYQDRSYFSGGRGFSISPNAELLLGEWTSDDRIIHMANGGLPLHTRLHPPFLLKVTLSLSFSAQSGTLTKKWHTPGVVADL